MKVVIIGSGNVATAFGRKILGAGHEILQVVSRNKKNATSLSSILSSSYTHSILTINEEADLYVIAVSDNYIGGIASQLKLNDQIVVHTAASVSKNVLQTASLNYGVIYPLQSLKKEIENIPPIPILIDGSSEAVTETLYKFCSPWADTVTVASDQQRLKLHVAAVFGNNFINYLLSLTEQYCKEEQLDFNLLYTLIKETIERTRGSSPSALQTGPAVRGDFETIKKHLEILAIYPELNNLYKALSDSIIRSNSAGSN